ncbi:MAG: ferredoxin [Candidatus Omnitrophota bacterium]
MAKVSVDDSLCTGCGLCASLCEDIFEMGDDNIAKVKGDSSEKCDLNEIASQCPVEAIKVE